MNTKLLLVEDDPTMQRMYANMFTRAGFTVITADDGTIVLETVMLQRPDIILMDVMMPNFNGLATLRELKTNPKTGTIPIIMLSAFNDEQLVEKALNYGAARYLVKSEVEPDDLVKTVQESVAKA
jgi:twitching motility two-component system response regulator PilH